MSATRTNITGQKQASSRSAEIDQLLARVLDDRAAGHGDNDQRIIADHPELMPELGQELAALGEIHRAFLSAQKAGPIQALPPADPAPVRGLLDAAAHATPPVIAGYNILGEIDSGGQATVFKAIQESTGRTVAIKVLPGGTLISSRHRARFEREVQVLASLDHPNIVGIIDRGRTADGSLFLVMNFIEGIGLDEFIARLPRQVPSEIDRVVRLFIEIAQAVEDAHRHGIVHRDLKPSNIRIDQAGRPHVLDFGLARLSDVPLAEESRLHPLTLTGQIVGSLPWASPEQVSGAGERVSARSDVYALGVILYQALTGRFPYSVEGSIRQTLDNIQKTAPLPPSHLLPARMIDRTLDAVVLKALAKSAPERYSSAGQLAADLQAYLVDQPTSADGVVVAPRPRPKLRWVLTCLIAAVLLIGGGVAYEVWYRPVPPAPLAMPRHVNSLKMVLVRLPAGVFRMGNAIGEPSRPLDESSRRVRLTHPFYIGVTEVTQSQYQALIGTPLPPQTTYGPHVPVHNISWEQANEFCRLLSRAEGKNYRLPTEAEWEYACRAGTQTLFAGLGDIDKLGWYKLNSWGQFHSVATKFPNGWGLFDMHGNAREWCLDWWHAAPRSGGEEFDPRGPTEGTGHVLRGGSVLAMEAGCRSTSRDRATAAGPDTGFRVVLESDAILP